MPQSPSTKYPLPVTRSNNFPPLRRGVVHFVPSASISLVTPSSSGCGVLDSIPRGTYVIYIFYPGSGDGQGKSKPVPSAALTDRCHWHHSGESLMVVMVVVPQSVVVVPGECAVHSN